MDKNITAGTLFLNIGSSSIIIERNGVRLERPSRINAHHGKVYSTEYGVIQTNDSRTECIYPVRDGVITDFDAFEAMIAAFLLADPRLDSCTCETAFVSYSSNITEAEKEAIRAGLLMGIGIMPEIIFTDREEAITACSEQDASRLL